MLRQVLGLGLALYVTRAPAEGLGADVLGVIYNRDDISSVHIAEYYAAQRHIPANNVIGLAVPDRARIGREELGHFYAELLFQ